MSQFRQSGPAILFLVAVLLSYSGPAEGGQKNKTVGPSTLKDTGSEWQTLEDLEEGSNEEMRMVGSVVAQRNQYPYMVRSHNHISDLIHQELFQNNLLKY
jgi:hypothetical protein